MSITLSSGPDPNSRDIMEVMMLDSTSMSSVPSHVPKGITSHRVAKLDVVCEDGSYKFGEMVEVEGGSYSTIRKVATIWDPSMVRSNIGTIGLPFSS